MPPQITLPRTPQTTWADSSPFSQRVSHSFLASIGGLSESGLPFPTLDTVRPAGAPDVGTFLLTSRWQGLQRGQFPWRNEEQDLQQAQGPQPLEGQWRDALEGIVAEDPEGSKRVPSHHPGPCSPARPSGCSSGFAQSHFEGGQAEEESVVQDSSV